MHEWIDAGLILLLLTNLFLLGHSRLGACIRMVAVQGVILGFLALASHAGELAPRIWVLAAATIALKSGMFPWLLARTLRGAGVRREIEPILGYVPSILAGVALLGLSFWVGSRLPVPGGGTVSPLALPIALFTMLTGLVLLIGRKKALTQVIGYLVLENGIFAAGAALVIHQPMLVETGVLLDVFFAVFVFGIAIFHISREFNHIDTDQLAALKD